MRKKLAELKSAGWNHQRPLKYFQTAEKEHDQLHELLN